MRKIIIGLLIVVSLFINGCGSITNEFKVKDVTLKFDQEKNFKNISYKNAIEITPDESRQAVYLEYVNKDIYDGRFVFRINMAYTNETTIDEFLGGRETKDQMINGINWKTVTINGTSNNKATTSNNYVTEKDGTIYVVTIIAFNEVGVDLNQLSSIFMNGVSIK